MWPEMTRVHARKAEEGFFAAETQLIFEGMQLMNALYTFEMFYAFSRFITIKNAPQWDSGTDPGFACNGSRAKPLLTHSSEGLGGGHSEKA